MSAARELRAAPNIVSSVLAGVSRHGDRLKLTGQAGARVDLTTASYILVLVIGALYLMTIHPGQSWISDESAMYVLNARSIAEGRAYADTGYIYNPAYAVLGPQTYPPVFPMALALVYATFGLNLVAMKIEIVGFFVASLAVTSLLFRERLNPPTLMVLLAVVGLSPYLWQFKDNVLSDISFLCFAYAALVAFEVAAARHSGNLLLGD